MDYTGFESYTTEELEQVVARSDNALEWELSSRLGEVEKENAEYVEAMKKLEDSNKLALKLECATKRAGTLEGRLSAAQARADATEAKAVQLEAQISELQRVILHTQTQAELANRDRPATW